MKADGSVIIDTKIIDGGMEKGFEQLKSKMNSVGVAAEKVGDKIKMSFSGDVTAPIQNAVSKVQELERQLEIATEGFYSAVYADDDKGAEKWARKRETVYARLEAAQRRLTQVVVSETNREAKAQERSYRKSTKAVRSFGKRLTGVVSSALVFSLISRGLRQVTEYMGKALRTNKQFVETSNKMKGALLTAFQPLYETLLPAIISGMEVIAKYALVIGRFFASITGKNEDQMKANAEALYDQASATEAAGDAAKKASQQIGGFDELNVMQKQDGGNADFNLEGIDLNSKLTEMVVMSSEALLAIGLLLAFSGINIPLGIGLIAMGAAGMYQSIAENWGSLGNRVTDGIDVLATIIYGALFVIGVLVAFLAPTHLALGIGMIIAGATGLASEVGLNWNAIKDTLQSPIGAIVGLLGGAILVAIGILVCSAGGWPLGIGLIVAGAAFLATTVAVNWNSIIEALRGPIGAIVALVSTAILAIGIILCFAGVYPLGIGLIVAGAAGLATTVAVNWNAIIEALRGPIGEIVALVSGSLLVLGIILCCVGVFPLGIGLILAGASGLAAVVAVNWNSIVDKVKEIWKGVKSFWEQNIAPVFTTEWWADLAKACGNGLITGFEKAINGIISMFETMINWIVGGLNKISFNVPDWVPGIGGKTFGFNIPEVQFSRVSIPRLAEGAVIPPNKEFMAVLGDQRNGTNIEAPLATIEEAVARVTGQQSEQMIAALYTLIDIVERKDLNVQIGDDDIGRANDRYAQNRGAQVNTGAFANAY